MASLRLRDLAPEWQARFHYNPAAEAPSEPSQAAVAIPTHAPVGPRPAKTAVAAAKNRFESLLQKFGQPAWRRPRSTCDRRSSTRTQREKTRDAAQLRHIRGRECA